MKYKRGDKVLFKGETYDFGYIGSEGYLIIYNEGECNMQDAVAVRPGEIIPALPNPKNPSAIASSFV